MTWQRRICWPLSPAAGSWPGNTSLLAKTGEIAALPVRLESLPRNKIVVTTDALHRFTACTLTGQGHDYALTDGERHTGPPADRAQNLAPGRTSPPTTARPLVMAGA